MHMKIFIAIHNDLNLFCKSINYVLAASIVDRFLIQRENKS